MSTVAHKRRRSKEFDAEVKVKRVSVVESSLAVPRIEEPRNLHATASLTDARRSTQIFLVFATGVVLLAAAFRFYALDLKPMHHDEGVNGFFLTNLIRQGIYKYDPTNYHGPTLYYLALPFTSILGLNNSSVRLLTAIAGVLTILLMLDLRRYLGSVATVSAAILIALSPGAVFYSRYFIHETLFVLFTLGIVVAVLRFYESKRVFYLVLAAVSTGLLFATKETAFVSIVTLGLAWLVSWMWGGSQFDFDKLIYSIFRFPVSRSRRRRTKTTGEKPPSFSAVVASFGGRDQFIQFAAYGVIAFLIINIIFYSSFFTNWPGVTAAINSLQVWTRTGTSEFHGKPFDTYLNWLLQEELPILILALGGGYVALFYQPLNRFAVFVSAWAFGMLAAYSLIPYKTPWLALNFVIPMALSGGFFIHHLSRQSWGKWKAPIPAIVVVFISLAILGYQTVVLNFREYDNDRYPYVYVHTSRSLTQLVEKVDQISASAGNKEIGINIASPENWPLPWYFRDYSHVGYVGSIADRYDSKETPIVIARESEKPEEDQVAKLRGLLGPDYERLGTYALRPGVQLALFARHDLVAK